MLERFKLLYEKFANTNGNEGDGNEGEGNEGDGDSSDGGDINTNKIEGDNDSADSDDDEKFSLLKSPYKIYLLIFLISIIILFLIIILAFTPSSYNHVNTQPYYNQNKIH